MGTTVSKRKNLRSDAISSVAAKVRAARAFGEYLSNTNPENRNGADHLLSDTFPSQDCDSPCASRLHNSHLTPQIHCLPTAKPNQSSQSNPSAHPQPRPQGKALQTQAPLCPSKRRLSAERSLSTEDPPGARGPVENAVVKPARVYTITREGGMTLGGRGSEESLELEVLKGSREQPPPQGPAPNPAPANHDPSCTSQPSAAPARSSHHRSSHHRSSHHHAHQHHGGPPPASQPLQSSGSASNIRDWGMRRGGSREDYTPDCVTCIRAPCQSQRSLDLDPSPQDGGKPRKKLERMYSEDRASTDDREDNPNSWFPKENMFSFQTATTTMQACDDKCRRGPAITIIKTPVSEKIKAMKREDENKVMSIDAVKVKLQIWDTAGQERFRSVTHAYYRDANALLLLYDVNNKASFDNIRAWLTEIHEYAQQDVVVMLLGNKVDSTHDRMVKREEGEKLAKEFGVPFMETSAKSGLNVELAFTAVAKELKHRSMKESDESKFQLQQYVDKEMRTAGCCRS